MKLIFSRRMLAHYLASLFLLATGMAQAEALFTFQGNVMIPMRDGVKLAANIFVPKQEGAYPVVLTRSPYGKPGENSAEAKIYCHAGYVMVVVDCRGRGSSEGVWDPFFYDVLDGFDTQEWVGKQPWSNGKIGTSGGSYLGWTQWSAASEGNHYLKAMAPVVPFGDAFHDIAYPGGAFQLSLAMGWGAAVGGIKIDPKKFDEAFRYLPLNHWDDQFGKEVFYLRDWVNHPTFDDYWRQRSMGGRYSAVTVPALNVGGWYDIFSRTTIDLVNRVRHESKDPVARTNQFVIIGPWGHGVGGRKTGELDFGDAAPFNLGIRQLQWFEHWLKDKDNEVKTWAPFHLFIMGENVWHDEYEWPLKRTKFTPYYFHSHGKANTRNGDGELSPRQPADEPADKFVYNPADPVPTHGGNNLVGTPFGPFDQSTAVEERNDVLVYTTAPLEKPVEVTGPVKAFLYAASSAKDTDFTAKLVDVYPDGQAINLCDGIIRARYRNSDTKLELIEPEQDYRYEIDLWVTSNLFQAGHRIRVEISSSNFPRFDRNPNSGQPFGTDKEVFKAQQTIRHDHVRASHILLPVIPR